MKRTKYIVLTSILTTVLVGCVTPSPSLPQEWQLPRQGHSTLINQELSGKLAWDGRCLSFVRDGNTGVFSPHWPDDATFDGRAVTLPGKGLLGDVTVRIGTSARMLGTLRAPSAPSSAPGCPGEGFDVVTMEN